MTAAKARRVLLVVLALLLSTTAAGLIVVETAWFKNSLRGYVVRQVSRYLNGQLSIERLDGNLFFGLELENVTVSVDGGQVVAVKRLGLDYNVFELIAKGLSVDQMRLDQPVLHLRHDGDTWSIARLIKKRQGGEPGRQGPPAAIAIDNIEVSDASVVIEGPVAAGVIVPRRIDHLAAKLSLKNEPTRSSVEIAHLAFRGSEPAIGLNELSGGVIVKDDTLVVDHLALRTQASSLSIDGAVQQCWTHPTLNVRISSENFSLPEIAPLVPALAGIWIQPAFELELQGPLDHLGVDTNIRSAAGEIAGRLVADVLAPGYSAAGKVSLRHLDLAPVLGDPNKKSDLAADVSLDVHATDVLTLDSLRGSVSLRVPRLAMDGYAADHVWANARFQGRRIAVAGGATAQGAGANAAGMVTLQGRNESLSYDLQGTVGHLDLRGLPATLDIPPVETNINVDFRVRGVEPVTAAAGSGARNMRTRALDADLQFGESIVAGARVAAGSSGTVAMLGKDTSYEADATIADLDLQRVGLAFKVPALTGDRFRSALNAHVKAKGRGMMPMDMDVAAAGTLMDSSLLGGRVPQFSFEASIAKDVAHVTGDGVFADFDPASVSGMHIVQGSVAGTLDLDAAIAGVSDGITSGNVEATMRATLESSIVGGLTINWANVDGDYGGQIAEIRDLEIVGPGLNVEANGTLALNDTGRSNLKFHLETPDLEAVAKLAHIPMRGIAEGDGTLTGNRTDLQAAGTLVGNDVSYGADGATGVLALSTSYTLHVPDLDYREAAATADTRATFVTIAGQTVNELAARTAYADRRVTFDATARQPGRTLAASGSLGLRPDAQDVHLEQLSLDTQGVQWRLASGSRATIQYGPDAVALKDVRLVSGNQEIVADGAYGRSGDQLTVTLVNVELSSVDALLLRPSQMSGRLNASSTISGSKRSPAVNAEFQVSQGSVGQFHYDTLGGNAIYAGTGVTLDARLQQNASQWVTAQGYLPAALFGPDEGGADDRLDFTVDSSPIDLGLIRGFTTAFEKVTGTLEAHVHIAGTAGNPEPSGAVTMRNGAASVEQTGVDYKNIAGRIDLHPDRVHIDQITVLDKQNNSLSVTGDLAIREGQLGGVALYVNSDDFKVMDNKIGNARIRSALEITGDLKALRIQGDLGVTTGRVDLDRVMALTGESPYPTNQAAYVASAAAEGQPVRTRMFDALKMDVGLSVPDDFLVKGNNLQTPGSPIGLGALNVTIGGDLHASKAPGEGVRVRGRVNTVRGTYDFQGRRFDILRDGTVRFDGLDQLDPALDVRAERVIQGVTARVNIRGTLSKPEIVLTSVPPLEQADILALVVFNQPINQVSEGQQISLAARAQAMATGAITSQLAQSIGHALNLDTFEIQLAPQNGGGPEVTIGQQVSQNLYVKVEQGIGDQSSTNVVLEDELTKWLRLQTNVVQGATDLALFRRVQDSGLDLIFFFSY